MTTWLHFVGLTGGRGRCPSWLPPLLIRQPVRLGLRRSRRRAQHSEGQGCAALTGVGESGIFSEGSCFAAPAQGSASLYRGDDEHPLERTVIQFRDNVDDAEQGVNGGVSLYRGLRRVAPGTTSTSSSRQASGTNAGQAEWHSTRPGSWPLSRVLTRALRPWETRTVTVEYLVAYASIPCSFALFTCRCGAFSVECDVRRGAPDNWTVAEDGSHLCPHCAPSTKQAS